MIFDLHNDFVTAVPSEKRDASLAAYAAAGVRGMCFAVWTSELSPDGAALMSYRAPRAPFTSLSAVEDLGSVRSDDYRSLLEKFSPAYVSLTWNGENPLAGGTGWEFPLTEKGIAVLGILQELDIPLDLSHLSDTAFRDALARHDGRLLVTHTAARSIAVHPRNITDEMAKRVADRGGLVGVAAVPNFLDDTLTHGKTCGREAYLRHLLHFAERLGAKSVAIGTDFNGAAYYPIGLSSYADFGALRYDLENTGMTCGEIEDIFFNNANNFFNAKEIL